MKALCFYNHGGPEVIRYADVPKPLPAPGQVLIEVRACALNHLDIWVRRGWPGLDLKMPFWGGADVSGVIAQQGDGVTDWKIGQPVVVDPGINTVEDEFTRRGQHTMSPGYHILGENTPGGLAQYVAVPAGNLLSIPDDVDFPEAAAPLLVTLTAWRMLMHRAGLRAGESVLVVGAGGGVNTMVTQIAKLAGAKVYVVASDARKAQKAAELGADVVINRSEKDWGREIHRLTDKCGVDIVVDNVGAATINISMKVVARGGRIVIVGNTSGPHAEIDIRYIFSKQISIIGSTMGTHQDFRDITTLLWQRKLRPIIDRIMPLHEGREAFRMLEDSDQFGKIVLVP
ncbi:MAG: zinc-binding dehydrogenase [Desulforhabdus sp.]|jgi:NADPH:quinone reductase-like Zn-dependent oxidoreductase|nr:zinc-binding dehydrogenase [Desulforhabdus sp.]